MATEMGSAHGVHDESVEIVVRTGERLIGLVREKPVLAIAVAGAVAGLFGGLVFSRASRLLFLAVAGFAANDLLHRGGRFDIDDVIKDVLSRISR